VSGAAEAPARPPRRVAQATDAPAAGAASAPASAARRPFRIAAVALLAALATLLLRLPFAAERLWDHDSVQFALAVADFDLAAHTPHPPGYPLYVGALRALAAAGVSPLAGMVALSILFQALGAALVAPVAARLAGERRGAAEAFPAAVVAAALYATNPLLWFYGELPLVYGVEAGLTVLLAWAALGMADGRARFLLACALFGLAGGIRPSTLVLLSPLFLAGLGRAWWGRRGGGTAEAPAAREPRAGEASAEPGDGSASHGEGASGSAGAALGGAGRWRLGIVDLLLGAAVGALAVAAWLLPLLAAAGGLEAYRRVGGEHFAALLPHTSILYGAGWPALAHNVEVLTKWAVQGLVPAGVMVLAVAARVPSGFGRGLRLLAARAGWIAAWALPAIAFFALFHVTKAGYTLIHLPALLVVAALAAAPALAARPARIAAAGLAAAALGAGLFLFGADRSPDQPRWMAAVRHEHNAGALAAYERHLDALLAVLDRQPAGRTLLAAVELSGTGAAGAEGFLYPYHRHLQWYAPEHPVALLVPEQSFALVAPGGRRDFAATGADVELPEEVDRVVFVLAAPPGTRLRLPPSEVLLRNDTFLVLATPLGEGLRVGPLRLRAVRVREAA
jgi:hypothetical protein